MERILELAKQAGLKAWSESALSPQEKKFAELIIEECIYADRTGPIRLGCADRVRNHFMVRE